MDVKWFAVSASVSKYHSSEGKYECNNMPMAIKAVSENEACGIAIKAIMKKYPVQDGWYNHNACAIEVPTDK